MYRISMKSIYAKMNSMMLKFRDLCHLVVFLDNTCSLASYQSFFIKLRRPLGRDNIVPPGVKGGECKCFIFHKLHP